MILLIYKGFDENFINSIEEKKFNIKRFLKFETREREEYLVNHFEETFWITYDDFAYSYDERLINKRISLRIVKSNIYDRYYPIPHKFDSTFTSSKEDNNKFTSSSRYLKNIFIDGIFIKVNNKFFGQYKDEWFPKNTIYTNYAKNNFVKQTFELPNNIQINKNNDIEIHLVNSGISISNYKDEEISYIRLLENIINNKENEILLFIKNNNSPLKYLEKLSNFCSINNINYKQYIDLENSDQNFNYYLDIAKNDIGLNIEQFRTIPYYVEPDFSKKIMHISQGNIIENIISSAENEDINENNDFFITAPTGTGKSLMFQVPAVYLGKKYNNLTIVIEPIKALMKDQQQKLSSLGYKKAAYLNSDVVSMEERNNIIENIKNNSIDILYICPETLLSCNLNTLIGDRKIGLFIVDEAHIVTFWGYEFRPDYIYLGNYIKNLRAEQIKKKHCSFTVCAFTATAINGGKFDMVNETIETLNLVNPIKFIAPVRNENIRFNISLTSKGNTLTRADAEYFEYKILSLRKHLIKWANSKEKTIVYFPYRSLAVDAYYQKKRFQDFFLIGGRIIKHPELQDLTPIKDRKLTLYTSSLDNLNDEENTTFKNESYENFKSGKKPIMFATSAFGMGIDINDIKNVYNFACPSSLFEYVQEIGRSGRNINNIGVSIIDYCKPDTVFVNNLHYLSRIRNSEINLILKNIFEKYTICKSESFLIDPLTLTYIFANKDGESSELDRINQIKEGLILCEKDLKEKFGFKLLFSEVNANNEFYYLKINKNDYSRIMASKYYKYIHPLTSDSLLNFNGTINYCNDVYKIDIKSLWFDSNPFDSLFKYKSSFIFNEQKRSMELLSLLNLEEFNPVALVRIRTRNDMTMNQATEFLFKVIDGLVENFKKRSFTENDLVNYLSIYYSDYSVLSNISRNLFPLLNILCQKEIDRNQFGSQYKSDKFIRNEETDTFKNHSVFKLTRDIMNMTPTIKDKIRGFELFASDARDVTFPVHTSRLSEFKLLLDIFRVLDLVYVEYFGGSFTNIYIQINDKQKFNNLLNNKFYKNFYVEKLEEKHKFEIQNMRTFFGKKMTDEQRWGYIEDYFLGKNN